jgi:hypothetical protein
MHVNPVICKSKAPFNPILGETFQVKKSNRTQLFLEQTCHHPPTSHYIIIGPDESYKIFGYATVKNFNLTKFIYFFFKKIICIKKYLII